MRSVVQAAPPELLDSVAAVGSAAYVRAALAEYRAHDFDAMIADTERYTTLTPRDPNGWSILGTAYQRVGRNDDAARAFGSRERRIVPFSNKGNRERQQRGM